MQIVLRIAHLVFCFGGFFCFFCPFERGEERRKRSEEVKGKKKDE